jgi:protease II
MDIEKAKQLAEDAVIFEKERLASKLEDLEREREHNIFLQEIADDYKKYNSVIIRQKEQQKKQLLKILNYLDELNETNAVTEYTLSHTQNEQKRLVNEIKNIQKEMDNINIQ